MITKKLFKVGKKSFMLVSEADGSVITGKFIYHRYKHPVKTLEVGGDLIIYYEAQTNEFIGFSKINSST